ncbi:MAG: sugar transferase, system associated [Planctomycetaceae bacterium]|nr:sugar transferase, system associated [Planctomycetaceae bacterium]
MSNRRLRGWMFVQRVIAAISLVLLSPLFLILWILVRFTSRGPFLYTQSRPGLHGQPFKAFKIRTMRPGSDKDQSKARCVLNSDPQVTKIGKILRNLKLDELPQLWNVVRGEMAFVGPRPIALSLYQELCREIPGFEERLNVHPGLTNLGQVCIEENLSQDRVVEDWKLRFEAERHYFHHRSVAYDCVIIGLTVLYILRKVVRSLHGCSRRRGVRKDSSQLKPVSKQPVQLDLVTDPR